MAAFSRRYLALGAARKGMLSLAIREFGRIRLIYAVHVSISAAQAGRFYQEVILHQQVWGIRDSGGFPAPVTGGGVRSMPFWSLRSRAEKVISSVAAYRDFEVEAIPLAVWRTRWIDGLDRDGILVGLNWSGVGATGYDFQPLEVRAGLEARE